MSGICWVLWTCIYLHTHVVSGTHIHYLDLRTMHAIYAMDGCETYQVCHDVCACMYIYMCINVCMRACDRVCVRVCGVFVVFVYACMCS